VNKSFIILDEIIGEKRSLSKELFFDSYNELKIETNELTSLQYYEIADKFFFSKKFKKSFDYFLLSSSPDSFNDIGIYI
jgi:hypothetical protein